MSAEYLTPTQAAQITGRHPVTIREALRGKTLRGFQRGKGGHWVIRPCCLDAWMEARACERHDIKSNVRPLRQRAV